MTFNLKQRPLVAAQRDGGSYGDEKELCILTEPRHFWGATPGQEYGGL